MKNKTKIISYVSAGIYGFLLLVSLVVIVGALVTIMKTESGSGLGATLTIIVMIVATVLALIYAAVSVMPMIFKLVFISKGKIGFNIACLPFDLIHIFIGIFILKHAIESATVEGYFFAGAQLLFALTTATLGVLALILERKPKAKKK